MAERAGAVQWTRRAMVLPRAATVDIGNDSRAAVRVCVAGGGAHVLCDLSPGRTFGTIDHPMAKDLGPFDRGRPASISIERPKSHLDSIADLFTLSFTAAVWPTI